MRELEIPRRHRRPILICEQIIYESKVRIRESWPSSNYSLLPLSLHTEDKRKLTNHFFFSVEDYWCLVCIISTSSEAWYWYNNIPLKRKNIETFQEKRFKKHDVLLVKNTVISNTISEYPKATIGIQRYYWYRQSNHRR